MLAVDLVVLAVTLAVCFYAFSLTRLFKGGKVVGCIWILFAASIVVAVNEVVEITAHFFGAFVLNLCGIY